MVYMKKYKGHLRLGVENTMLPIGVLHPELVIWLSKSPGSQDHENNNSGRGGGNSGAYTRNPFWLVFSSKKHVKSGILVSTTEHAY